MKLTKMLKSIGKHVLPEVNVNEDNKYVELKSNVLGSNITEAYYIFKGYTVERV